MHYFVFICGLTEGKKIKKTLYLEVSHHDESGSTDPACGQTCRVEDAVLVLLDDVGITEQHDHHHYSQGDTHKERQWLSYCWFTFRSLLGKFRGKEMGIFLLVLEKNKKQPRCAVQYI